MPADCLYKRNLNFLKKKDPILASRVVRHGSNLELNVIHSQTSLPVPVINSVSLHSRYDPEKEAQGLIEAVGEIGEKNCLVFGLGFGYHIKEVQTKNPEIIWVVEPSMELFKGFLESSDLSEFSENIEFFIDESPAHIVSKINHKNILVVEHPPSVRLRPQFYEKLKIGLKGAGCIEKNSLRILVIPPIYGGSLPTARFCFDSLKDIGHIPFWVNCDKYAEAFHDMQETTGNKDHDSILSRKFLEYLSEMIIARAAQTRPDIILALAQAPLDAETVQRLKALGAPIAFWFVEDFRTLTYWKEMAGVYDSFFTIQKGEFFKYLNEIGVQNPHYLPQACNPEVHQALEKKFLAKDLYDCDIGFMGAAYYNRTRMFEQLLNYDFKIWGTGWETDSIYGPHLQKGGERVTTEESVEIYNSAKINLNLHSSTFHEGVNPNGDFVNPRTFEIAACGGFQLVDERSELSSLFETGKEMITFNGTVDLKNKLDFYLQYPEERKRIAGLSYARVVKDHTFNHRMRELLIQIYIEHAEKIDKKLENYQDQWNALRKQSGDETSLNEILDKYKDTTDLELGRIRDDIREGEGALTAAELLILMVDQVVKR